MEQIKKQSIVVFLLLLMGVSTASAKSLGWYTGEVSFPVTVTYMVEENGIVKLYKDMQTFTGKFYFDTLGKLQPSQLGSTYVPPFPCYAAFISDDRINEIWIFEGSFLSTNNPKSKSEKFVFIGTGVFFDYHQEVGATAYMDVSGTWKKDKFGVFYSMSMKGKLGVAEEVKTGFIVNGQFSSTLSYELLD